VTFAVLAAFPGVRLAAGLAAVVCGAMAWRREVEETRSAAAAVAALGLVMTTCGLWSLTPWAGAPFAGPSGGEPWTVPGLGVELAPVRAGEFAMGSPKTETGRDDDERRRLAVVPAPFWMGAHEVTQEQFESVMGRNPSSFKGPRRPVEMVNWYDAVGFCRRLTERERAAARLPEGHAYRLPTEAEWEYACRAGSTTPFAVGAALSGREANFDANQPYGDAAKTPRREATADVGVHPPNAWGLHDMHGNVWEWCLDPVSPPPAPDAPPAAQPPADGSLRARRGGAWCDPGVVLRSANRDAQHPTCTSNYLGFRVVLAPTHPSTAP